jgi:hypothetical protein
MNTMSFASILKGRLAERIVVSLLERGGFRVTRLGIEELFDEIKYLGREEYLALGLPSQLRTLPDLLVADPGVTWAVMMEIKFRRRFDSDTARDLHKALQDQRQLWPDAWALIMIAEPFVEGGRFHQDYIRLLGPDDLDKLIEMPAAVRTFEDERAQLAWRWDHLPMLTKLFYHAHGDDERGTQLSQQFWAGADFVTAAIKELRSL